MRRKAAYAGGLGAMALALAVGWACLPDLQISPIPAVCGNGLIEPDAGEECDPGDAAALGCDDRCLVACSPDVLTEPFPDTLTDHCYFSAGTINTIDRAMTACEGAGAHLVRLASDRESRLVMNGAPASPFWVGLQRNPLDGGTWPPYALPGEPPSDEPGWTSGCPGCFAHVAADAADLPLETPDAARGNCVESPKDESVPWTQTFCVLGRETICEREPVGTRTSPCGSEACFTVPATQARKSYVLFKTPMTASAAATACASVSAHLVVFESPDEREEVAHEVETQPVFPGVNDFWIGLSLGASGVWAWDEAGAGGILVPPWGVGEPRSAPSGAGRAFVLVAPGSVESELAHVSLDRSDQHAAVCQR